MRNSRQFVVLGTFLILAAPSWAQSVFDPGLLWRYPDAGAGWTPKTVSLGAHGTQVFSEIEFGSDKALLLSAFDQGTAVPVWQDAVPLEAANTFVDSAETTDTHVSIHQIVLGGNQSTKQSVATKYSSRSANPEWSYTFPSITSGSARIGISNDGQRIVAVSQVTTVPSKLAIAVFGPSSGTPQYFGEINFGTSLRGFDLSADGSTLYVTSGSTVYIWNTTTHTQVAAYVLPLAHDCHAISGNGSVFAFGGFNRIHVFERNGSGTYTQTYVREIPGPMISGRVDISEDSSTIAYTFVQYDTELRVRIEALDVASKTITMSDDAIGTGTYENYTSDISISRNGGRFAVGLWGDQGNICPELRVYSSRQGAPLLLHNFSGSVFDVDISADGQRVAVAAKAVHANQYEAGGELAFFAVEEDDLRAIGVPRASSNITLHFAGAPNSPAFLLASPQLAIFPTEFIPIGTLFLRRDTLTFLSMGSTDASGLASRLVGLPPTIGATLYFQGLSTVPRRLSADWVRVTTLP